MTSTRRSSGSSVLRPLSPSSSSSAQILHNQQRSASPCNLNLRLWFFSSGNIPKPSDASVAVSSEKKTCLCSPTTHPGSFRCAFHRRLESQNTGTLISPTKRNKCGNTSRNSGLNLRKVALMNHLARIGSVEAERFRRCLAASLIKPSFLHIQRLPEFRPRPSRFYILHKDQD